MSAPLSPTPVPVPAQWDASKLPDVSGKTVVITGGATGIGFITALELARRGAHVIIACHLESQGIDAQTKINDAIQEANSATTTATPAAGGRVEYMHLDVSKLSSVRAFSDAFKKTHNRLDVLVLNAGIVAPEHTMTDEGLELEFATNYLGHFALVSHLLEVIQKTPDQARILTVSSVLHQRAASFQADALMVTDSSAYNRIHVYASTKLYALLFTLELQRKLEAKGLSDRILSVATHPGVVATSMMDGDLSGLGVMAKLAHVITRRLMHAPEFGALPLLYAAAAHGVKGSEYYGPDGFLGIYGYPTHTTPSAAAQSLDHAKQLWVKSEEMASVKYDL